MRARLRQPVAQHRAEPGRADAEGHQPADAGQRQQAVDGAADEAERGFTWGSPAAGQAVATQTISWSGEVSGSRSKPPYTSHEE